MNLTTVNDRQAVQNWMDEKPNAMFRIKPSNVARRGHPGLGAWSNIRSASEIPCGLRFTLERSLGENEVSKIYVLLEEVIEESPTESSDVHDGVLVAQDKQELEHEFNRLSRSALTLSAASQSVACAASMAADAVVKSLEMQDRAQQQLAAATVGNAQASFYQTLGFAVEQLTSVARVYLAKDLDAEEKEAVKDFLKMSSNLKRHGVDIKKIKPGDFASYQALSEIPQVRQLLDEMARRNITQVMTGATEIGEEVAAGANNQKK